MTVHVSHAVPWNPRPDSIGVVHFRKFLGKKTPFCENENNIENVALWIFLEKHAGLYCGLLCKIKMSSHNIYVLGILSACP